MRTFVLSMSKVALAAGVLLVSIQASAQQDKSKRPSPPAKVEQKVGSAQITIEYSRPSVKGREVFGGIVPYGKVWRTGANEATTFTTDKDITINGKKLPAGTYGLFTIPGEKEWTIIFNKNAKQWGSGNYKEEEDQLRVTAKPQSTAATEMFTITVDEKGKAVISWDKTMVAFTIK